MRTRDVTLGSGAVSVSDAGDGAPLLLLHAFPLSARMWAPQLAALPAGWRAIAPDLRGLGRSPRGASPALHVRDHAADVLALIDALGLPPVVLAGVSMGGYVAFEIWRQRPSAIRALVLADTRAEADTDEARARRVALQARAASEGTAAVVDAMLPGLIGATTQTDEPHLAMEVRQWALEAPADGVVDALDALRTRPDSRPDLPSISCPALVIVGEEDTLTPPDVARVMADGIRGAAYVPIRRAGHLANVEQPQAFNAALHAWLATLPA
jgi:pimeloyl-ACP methyl ester carboxylesterase